MRRMTLLSRFTLSSALVTIIIAALLAWILQNRLEQIVLRQEAESAAGQVSQILSNRITSSDLYGPIDPQRQTELDRLIQDNILRQYIVRVKLWNADGQVRLSDDPDSVGKYFPLSDELSEALSGGIGMEVSDLEKAENVTERQNYSRLMEIYVPLRLAQQQNISGAFEVYHDLAVIEPYIQQLRLMVWGGVELGFLILYLTIFGLVRRASITLEQRDRENARQAADLRAALQELNQTYHATLTALVGAIDIRDTETKGHSERVMRYSVDIARKMGLEGDTLRRIELGALLHDVGKIGIPDAILRKPGPLTNEEWGIMRLHPELGCNLLEGIPFLQDAQPVVAHHHERFDGRGYPRKLRGKEIPLEARIFAVADTFDAITSDRPYRRAQPYRRAVAEIQQGAGSQFDPQIVETFLSISEEELRHLRYDLPAEEAAEPLEALPVPLASIPRYLEMMPQKN